ncbi:hypothetical protein FJZ21_03800 [Candidatus Pacearchaeota archaeon]|nr:hypothetical protein [Candidatus Pacearchaeota archaeon]
MKLRVMIVLLAFALLPLASSSIFIEPLKNVYNYGDQISVDTVIVPSTTTASHYIVDLKCGTTISYNIFNNFLQAQSGIEKPVVVVTELLNPLLENLTDPCYLRASFGGELVNSNTFTLSKVLNLESELEFDSLNPGNTFRISGNSITKSGVPVNGFVELFIPSLNLYKSSIITDGEFNLTIYLPLNAKSGEHDYKLEVHNTDYNSKKINFGSNAGKFTIGQILKEVKINVNEENAKPESDFIFRVDAIDQAGDIILKEVSLTINQPKGIPFIKKVIKSGEDQKISFMLSDLPGYWSIETDVEGIKNRKLFYLAEVNRLQSSLIDDTLIITNIGNALYNGPIEISVGDIVEIRQIKLGPGQTEKLSISAPDGEYKIAIVDKEGEAKELGSAFLTGNAVKVTNFKEDFIYTFTSPLIWWLGVALLVLVVILVQVKIRIQKMPRPSPAPSPTTQSDNVFKPSKIEFTPNTRSNIDSKTTSSKKFDMSWLNNKPKPIVSAPASVPFSTAPKVNPVNLFGVENHGIRERAAAIALYVTSNSPAVLNTMNRALSLAQENGAKVYVDGDYKIVLFSPRLTRNQDNERSAVNVARRMQAIFLEHMSMSSEGNFGLGVSDGEIISEIEGGKFHFTSTGNLISYAKRLAHASNAKLLISDSIRRKLISTVKAEKSPYQGVWEVTKVIDYSPSKDFIKRFSDRNK